MRIYGTRKRLQPRGTLYRRVANPVSGNTQVRRNSMTIFSYEARELFEWLTTKEDIVVIDVCHNNYIGKNEWAPPAYAETKAAATS